MPKVLFAGGRLDSVVVAEGSPTEDSNFTGGYNTSYADCSIRIQNNMAISAIFRDTSNAPVDVVTGETLYFHWDMYTGISISNTVVLEFRDSAGQPWLSVRSVSSAFGLYYNSGTGASPTWTLVGSTFSTPSSVLATYDIKLTLGSPHTVEAYKNNNLVASGTFSQALLTALRNATPIDKASDDLYFSQLLATEGIPTINAKVKYTRGTAAGANSQWTGTVSDVNEPVNSDVTVNTASAAGLRQTYAMGDVTVPVGYVISSVFHWMRGRNDGTAPTNIKSVVRSGGTEYLQASNAPGIGLGFSALPARWDTNPNTSTSWTAATWNAVEVGYESVA
jgi:hypothetical protein